MAEIKIHELITVDDTGMPKAPNLYQILDKDIKLLYQRDVTPNKTRYIQEVGVIYQLGNPNSMFKQEGLSDNEIISRCIEYYDLPLNYYPDVLVLKLAKRYYQQKITPAGVALEALQRAVHNEVVIINKLNEILTDKLNTNISIDDANTIIGICKNLNDKAKDIPELSKAITEAYENVLYEKETKKSRGGNAVVSSMVEE